MSAATFLKSSVLKYRRGKRQKDRMGWGQEGTGQDRWDCQPYLGQLLSVTSACKTGRSHTGSDDLGTGNI